MNPQLSSLFLRHIQATERSHESIAVDDKLGEVKR